MTNVFGGSYLDRSAVRRTDETWLAGALRSPASRFVPVCGDDTLVSDDDRPRARLVAREEIEAIAPDLPDAVFLGERDGTPLFSIDLPESAADALDALGRLENIRRHATRVPEDDAGLLAYARAMSLWHRSHGYCPRCGSPADMTAGGHLRVCGNDGCAVHQFPRMDPAVIVLVSRGDHALLGRQASWPAGVYSTVAGFVEPGESLEDAVRREVEEETNIRVGAVSYHSSQPWPFPCSIMLGFTAEAESSDIVLNDQELEDARWFTRDEIAERVSAGSRAVPARLSIAFRLVSHWYDRHEPGALAARIAESRSNT